MFASIDYSTVTFETRKLMTKLYILLEPLEFEQSPPNDSVVRV